MLTGVVRLDLTGLAGKAERMHARAGVLASVPTGARVVVYVGPLGVEPSVVRVIRLHERRLRIEVEGEPFAVAKWLDAVRTGLGEELVLNG